MSAFGPEADRQAKEFLATVTSGIPHPLTEDDLYQPRRSHWQRFVGKHYCSRKGHRWGFWRRVYDNFDLGYTHWRRIDEYRCMNCGFAVVHDELMEPGWKPLKEMPPQLPKFIGN